MGTEIVILTSRRTRRDVKITISVPIHLEGEAVGVEEGGVLSQILTSIDIECLPIDVPEFITLDTTELEMNSSLSVADITVSGEITKITDEEQVIATITPPKEEEEPVIEIEEGEEGEETAEGETAEGEGEGKAEGGDASEESTE